MAASTEQSYARHAQYVPGFHFVTLGLALLLLILAVVQAVRTPGLASLTTLAGAGAIAGLGWYARAFPIRVQDRLICLEERLRLARLLPADLQSRVDEFTPGQLIALRFASDAELPALARKVLADGIRNRDAIKRLVADWRTDRMRV